MEITGKIFLVLPEVSGMSKAGRPWKKKEYVLETQETYPKKVFFDVFGERADQISIAEGDFGTLSFDIESHEYNGRWFTSIRGWGWRKETPGAAPAAPQAPYNAPASQQAAPGSVPPPPPAPTDSPDDLPF